MSPFAWVLLVALIICGLAYLFPHGDSDYWDDHGNGPTGGGII